MEKKRQTRIDPLSPEERSARMARIRGKNTKPELTVRRLLYEMGYRFRLHRKGLPGSPDIVFVGRKKAIFVHGCFWHQHGCGSYKMPQSGTNFWGAKLAANVERDRRNLDDLRQLGWTSLQIWECELKNNESLRRRLTDFLGPRRIPKS